jgi:hypothetical protein
MMMMIIIIIFINCNLVVTRWQWLSRNLVIRGGYSPRWAAEPQEAIARAGLQSHRRP